MRVARGAAFPPRPRPSSRSRLWAPPLGPDRRRGPCHPAAASRVATDQRGGRAVQADK
ncbi:hypothetical protein BU14_0074s0059 [Porphyra umbilicalis]|uniref:Uncharacterized protein n=1 Tax=Porphyra umbilicalis TaxID=2786 RepID=A0A1X6PFK4_PORUM|nr:hypothetical protein BU14_0074s0059 [Porphyra umbilicalis]|eukprot:OSX79629.1 hypothetical protein BU14_0074s0059 [Porphyra umbilicalis]